MFEKRQQGSSRTRQTGFSIYPACDADGVRRIIPNSMWDGRLGEQLRALGLSPDGVNNIIADETRSERNFNKKFAEQAAFFEYYNTDPLAGVKVIPFAILPWELWQRDHAAFLLEICDLYPVEAWNTMMLPKDMAGAGTLNLVAHPRGYPKEYVNGCNNVIGEIRDDFIASFRTIERDVKAGNCHSDQRHTILIERTKHTVIEAASTLAAMLLSEENYQRHQTLFGHMF